MASHNTNRLLKYGLPVLLVFLLVAAVYSKISGSHTKSNAIPVSENYKVNGKSSPNASNDSAAESLDTLTASLAETKKQMTQIAQDNTTLKSQNQALLQKIQGSKDTSDQSLADQLNALKQEVENTAHSGNYTIQSNNNTSQPITTVSDIAAPSKLSLLAKHNQEVVSPGGFNPASQKPKPIPYYTIPANATAVDDKLMTSLIGRIPIKGVVTDPYPFKIIFSDDTLAASGWRVPHLRQMIVGGFSEGDLNLLSVRGWVTSLSFVFDDGRIYSTSSNNNDIGHFTKENALGYLSDKFGNPFMQGKLITNAPAYLTGNVALGAAEGAANAYAQMQTTTQTSILGPTSTTVTGSPTKYVMGQAGVNAASEAQQWWHDRQENSFDAIYVKPGEEIVVNFAKEIRLDYNPVGRKIDYGRASAFERPTHLD